MKFYQEVTVWNTSYSVQNHIYYVNDSKTHAVGYIRRGTKKLIKFSKPMRFESRGRKFVLVNRVAESDTVYFPKTKEEKPIGQVREVSGSNGKTYFVSKVGNRYTCTCPGFMFRHKCKHVEEAQQ